MSELSPTELAKLANSQEHELQSPFDLALQLVRDSDMVVKATNTSERYPYKKWRVSEPISDYHPQLVDFGRGNIAIGYPIIRGQKSPDEIHIIYDGIFGAPWASMIAGGDIWEQRVNDLYTDTAMSPQSQRQADVIISEISQMTQHELARRKRVRQERLKTGAVFASIGAFVVGGFVVVDAVMERQDQAAATAEAAIVNFDKSWIGRELTQTKVSDGEQAFAHEGGLPGGLPMLQLEYNKASEKLLANSTGILDRGIVRAVHVESGECKRIGIELTSEDSMSAAVDPTTSAIVVAIDSESDTVQICNVAFPDEEKTDVAVALQITPSSIS